MKNAKANLRSEILTSTDLYVRPNLNGALVDFINAAFYQPRIAKPESWTVDRLVRRFPHSSGLINMLGDAGFCAVIFDEVDGVETIVATSSIVSCGAELVGSYWYDEDSANEFELKAVATHPSSMYRRRGLASRCCKLLEDVVSAHLLADLASANDTEAVTSSYGYMRLWLYTVEEDSGDYWRRRGFQETERHALPVGTWGCKKERTMLKMMRDVPLDTGVADVPKLSDAESSNHDSILQPYLTNQALTDKATTIAQHRDGAYQMSTPRQWPGRAQIGHSELEKLRESCRDLLKPSTG